jgi:CheY-like chemotaxis protein
MSFLVLLVDDDPDTQAVFQDTLNHYGIELEIADGEQSALNAVKEHTPDIIVLDIFLPDTDGYKLLQVLRGMPDVVKCPIIATTGYYTTDTVNNLQRRGFDGYLLKPLDPQELVPYLQSIVG